MKFSVYLAVLSLTATLSTAYATDMPNQEDEISGYCKEQAELAGVEDMNEQAQYIKDCVESFGPPIDIQQSAE